MPDHTEQRYCTGLMAALMFASDYAKEGCGTFAEGVDKWGQLHEAMKPSNILYLRDYKRDGRDD
jgi:hypothetical protein